MNKNKPFNIGNYSSYDTTTIINENNEELTIIEAVDLLNEYYKEINRMKTIVKEELIMGEFYIEKGDDPRRVYVRLGTFIRLMKEILGENYYEK